MKTFEIKKNEKYTIVEKPTADTPEALRKVGRAKQGGGFFEYADIPYDESTMKYDTGLDKTSREFIGKSEDEVQKILNDRKDLIEYHKMLVSQHPEHDERKVIASNRLKVHHNLIVDTSNIANWYKLHLAIRGNTLTPSNDKGNLARKSSLYVIYNEQTEVNASKELAKKKMKARKWLLNKLESDRKEALEYLRYEGILSVNQDKDDELLVDMFERTIENFDKLESFIYAIEKVQTNDIYMTNDVKRMIEKNALKREKGNWVFEGIELGGNIQEVVKNLKKNEFSELALKFFNKKEKE